VKGPQAALTPEIAKIVKNGVAKVTTPIAGLLFLDQNLIVERVGHNSVKVRR
jgi:hypothetical protein